MNEATRVYFSSPALILGTLFSAPFLSLAHSSKTHADHQCVTCEPQGLTELTGHHARDIQIIVFRPTPGKAFFKKGGTYCGSVPAPDTYSLGILKE